MKAAIEFVASRSTPVAGPGGAYDQDKVSYGDGCGLFFDGLRDEDVFVGPQPVATAYLGEAGIPLTGTLLSVVDWTDTESWMFTAAASDRAIQMWKFNKASNATSFVGSITLTMPTAGTHTTQGLKVFVKEQSTTGSVAVSGTTVTGTGTDFTTGFSVGSWIQFGPKGSNNPYYEIAAIGSATSITLTLGVPVAIAAGSQCRIVDMMVLYPTRNGTTATLGGLFVVKGLNPDCFRTTSLVIPAATTVDKIRAVYSLTDAATNTQISPVGVTAAEVAADTMVSQFCYCLEGLSTTVKVFKYNFRAPLTLTGGIAVLAAGTDCVSTSIQSPGGSLVQSDNGIWAKLAHGPGSGVDCIYALMTDRVIRIPIASVTTSSLTFIADSMVETPPGGTATNLSAGSFTYLEASTRIDRLLIVSSTGSGTMYCTQYNTAAAQYERRFGLQTSQRGSNQRMLNQPDFVHFAGNVTPLIKCSDSFMYVMNRTTTATFNQINIQPLRDYLYTTTTSMNGRVILPRMVLPADFFIADRLVVNAASSIGDELWGVPTEAFKPWYRISGISDNSGTWLGLAQNGKFNFVPAGNEIQISFTFRMLGMAPPARILSAAVLYQSNQWLPDEFVWNFSDSDEALSIVGFTQVRPFCIDAPTLVTRYFRSDTNAQLFLQASTGTTNGTFQFHNGTTWVAGVGPDATGTRRRFVPTTPVSLGVGVYTRINVI